MSTFFERLVEVALPRGGQVVAIAEAYFDESGTHDGSPVMCVAGYIFEADAAKRFSSEWQAVLDRYELPYFHMKECIGPSGVFSHLDKDEADQVERSLIKLVRQHMTLGVASMVDRRAFELLMPEHPIFKDDYHYCALRTLTALRAGLQQKGKSFEEISYFFEAGHESQSALGHVVYGLMQQPDWKEWFKYKSHSFVAKRDAPPVQAADLLAWHFTKSWKRWNNDQPPRKDMVALIGDDKRHWVTHDNTLHILDNVSKHMELGWWGDWQGFSELRTNPSLGAE